VRKEYSPLITLPGSLVPLQSHERWGARQNTARCQVITALDPIIGSTLRLKTWFCPFKLMLHYSCICKLRFQCP
jgi:hypothetical protein